MLQPPQRLRLRVRVRGEAPNVQPACSPGARWITWVATPRRRLQGAAMARPRRVPRKARATAPTEQHADRLSTSAHPSSRPAGLPDNTLHTPSRTSAPAAPSANALDPAQATAALPLQALLVSFVDDSPASAGVVVQLRSRESKACARRNRRQRHPGAARARIFPLRLLRVSTTALRLQARRPHCAAAIRHPPSAILAPACPSTVSFLAASCERSTWSSG
jgi:hypothetical protein